MLHTTLAPGQPKEAHISQGIAAKGHRQRAIPVAGEAAGRQLLPVSMRLPGRAANLALAHRALMAARACSLLRALSGDLTLPPLLPVARVSTMCASRVLLQCGQFIDPKARRIEGILHQASEILFALVFCIARILVFVSVNQKRFRTSCKRTGNEFQAWSFAGDIPLLPLFRARRCIRLQDQ